MVIVHQSGMPHFTIAMILKNKNKVTEYVTGAASLKAMRLTQIWDRPYIRHGETSNDIDWRSDREVYIPLSIMMIVAKAKSLFTVLKEEAGPNCDVEFIATSGWLKWFQCCKSLHSEKW